MAIKHQHLRRQWPWRIYQVRQVQCRQICVLYLQHILRPPTQRRVSKHLPPPVKNRIPHPSALALLNHVSQLRQRQRPEQRHHTIALWNCPLCGHPVTSWRRVVRGTRAIGRPLHSSEYELVAQFSKLVPPRLVSRSRCAGRSGWRNRVQAGAHEHIERDAIVITVRAQCRLPVGDLAASAQRDVQ
ncbi:hypothetical protein TRVL_06552 [Trypanosoma vivax]|nr:hypothetical protein TRVL_06552 [Trypanosoma vivax]